uniref:Putative portal protein n=1 Tax=viral metagenome TaxID=1070528 RepID=A0A6M3J730_9ZZZZ
MLIRRALERRFESVGSVDISQANGVLTLGFGGGPTNAGTNVSENTADSIPAVYACVRILAESISQAPLLLYRQLDAGGREEAIDHPLYSILRWLPNPELTAIDLRETLARWLFLWGNAYAEIIRDGQGRVKALWPLRSDSMEVLRDRASRRKRYRYAHPDGTSQTWDFDPERPPIHHWMINSRDGLCGRSPIRVLRESMGLTKAAEELGARYFGTGAQPGGILKTAGKLDPDRAKRMREDWERMHGSLDRAHRIAVFEQGLEFQAITVPPDDAQFIETRKFQDTQIAGIYGVPPQWIGAEGSNNWGAGVESQKNGFITFTLGSPFEKIQQASKRDLLGRKDFERYVIEFDQTELRKGSFESRMKGYSTALNWHINTVNEVREIEGWNPLAGGDQPMPPLSTSSEGSSKDSTSDAGNAVGTEGGANV